ncbi:MAG: hypothetical protein EBU36_05175 [Verrucomicrobia bacterium]|jgi:hypothetical protein|nr:hypothetical protein [Verrucomicrobiota bacterium]
MITRPPLWIWLAFLFIATTHLTRAQDADFQGGASPYTPQQLHELLAGQSKQGVLNFFGRMPNHIRGVDWFYEHLMIYIMDQDQYYTVAVVCFSQADGRVWQVVCYPN